MSVIGHCTKNIVQFSILTMEDAENLFGTTNLYKILEVQCDVQINEGNRKH